MLGVSKEVPCHPAFPDLILGEEPIDSLGAYLCQAKEVFYDGGYYGCSLRVYNCVV